MSKSKHKLSGYAINGDGTQETAERIRKVFEADGWDCVNWSFMGVSGNSAYYGDAIDHKIYYYYSDKPTIPLTEAERIVFGDEKQKTLNIDGFYVVFSGDESVGILDVEWKITGGFEFQESHDLETFKEKLLEAWEYASDTPIYIESFEDRRTREKKEDCCLNDSKPTEDELKVGMKVVSDRDHSWLKKGKIYEIKLLEGNRLNLIPEGETNSEIYADTSWLEYLSRATITDFLRTLPSDIAERALRQVDEKYEGAYWPCSVSNALGYLIDWRETEEGENYWEAVANGNYDRARAILAEKDRVGKWWKRDSGGVFRCTGKKENGSLYGYGVNVHGEWIDRTDETRDLVWCNYIDLHNLTPATPEEVEAVLNAERVRRGYKKGSVIKLVDYPRKVLETNKFKYFKTVNTFGCQTVDDAYLFNNVFDNGKWAEIITPAPEKSEPAVMKDVVEQIRDFRDKYFSENGTLTGHYYAELTDIINNHPQP